MCRWITLISAERYSLSDVVLAPSNSLIQLSRDASFHPDFTDANNAIMNGDGFGIGWYHNNIAIYPDLSAVSHDGSSNHTTSTTTAHPSSSSFTLLNQNGVAGGASATTNHHLNNGGLVASPAHAHAHPPQRVVGLDAQGHPVASAAVFKDVLPAWNNINLRELCMATSSDCIMAHVRAASKGSGISHPNCHPFKAGRLLFCHNGRIFEFFRFRRRFRELLTDEAYNSIMGTTDSEHVFALLLTYLSRDNIGSHNDNVSPFDQTTPFGAKRLVAALKKTINTTQRMIQEFGTKESFSTFNFALTDGESMVVTRFCDKGAEVPPPSLYFAFGDAHALYRELTNENGKPLFSSKNRKLSSASFESTSGKSDSSVHSVAEDVIMNDNGSYFDGNSNHSNNSDEFDERVVPLLDYISHPGKIMVDVEASTAAFIVSSNPLTKTHTWHPMPRNSIMWCTRGSHPELSVLKRRQGTMMSLTDLKL